MVLAQISMTRFEVLVARDRLHAFWVTGAVAAVIMVFLVWYLRPDRVAGGRDGPCGGRRPGAAGFNRISRRNWRARGSIQPDASGKLQEAFLNLLTNAMDAMPNGGLLRLETRSIDGAIRVTIADTGIGIAEADLEKIFEPFFSTKERGKGTGLGLSICRNIVRAHGGEIEAESRRGVGTTLIITLPVRDHEIR